MLGEEWFVNWSKVQRVPWLNYVTEIFQACFDKTWTKRKQTLKKRIPSNMSYIIKLDKKGS